MDIEDEFEKVEAVISADTQKIEAIVEAWWAKHFHNSTISSDTTLYNSLHAAKEELKNTLSTNQQ